MENEQEAQQAIRSLNGHILNGNRINVEVSTALYSLSDISYSQPFVLHRASGHAVTAGLLCSLSCKARLQY